MSSVKRKSPNILADMKKRFSRHQVTKRPFNIGIVNIHGDAPKDKNEDATTAVQSDIIPLKVAQSNRGDYKKLAENNHFMSLRGHNHPAVESEPIRNEPIRNEPKDTENEPIRNELADRDEGNAVNVCTTTHPNSRDLQITPKAQKAVSSQLTDSLFPRDVSVTFLASTPKPGRPQLSHRQPFIAVQETDRSSELVSENQSANKNFITTLGHSIKQTVTLTSKWQRRQSVAGGAMEKAMESLARSRIERKRNGQVSESNAGIDTINKTISKSTLMSNIPASMVTNMPDKKNKQSNFISGQTNNMPTKAAGERPRHYKSNTPTNVSKKQSVSATEKYLPLNITQDIHSKPTRSNVPKSSASLEADVLQTSKPNSTWMSTIGTTDTFKSRTSKSRLSGVRADTSDDGRSKSRKSRSPSVRAGTDIDHRSKTRRSRSPSVKACKNVDSRSETSRSRSAGVRHGTSHKDLHDHSKSGTVGSSASDVSRSISNRKRSRDGNTIVNHEDRPRSTSAIAGRIHKGSNVSAAAKLIKDSTTVANHTQNKQIVKKSGTNNKAVSKPKPRQLNISSSECRDVTTTGNTMTQSIWNQNKSPVKKRQRTSNDADNGQAQTLMMWERVDLKRTRNDMLDLDVILSVLTETLESEKDQCESYQEQSAICSVEKYLTQDITEMINDMQSVKTLKTKIQKSSKTIKQKQTELLQLQKEHMEKECNYAAVKEKKQCSENLMQINQCLRDLRAMIALC